MTAHLTGQKLGIASCPICSQLVDVRQPTEVVPHCPRCLSAIYPRKPHSLSKSWAFLIAAFILYIPANIFPIMTLTSFARESRETILSGIYQLFVSGQIGIGLVVFFASIFVPIFKIGALIFLVLSVQLKMQWRPLFRAKLYRFVEWIGRWSMIDIFMISVLIALVRLKELASIEPGAGALAFAAVVLLTMFASHSFDPRLIWDNLKEKEDV